MYFKRDSTFHHVTAPFLNLMSLVFKTLSLCNLKLKSLRRKSYPQTFIISVDNLSFGGTGKSTLVMEIARQLENNGLSFAIVTRGYHSQLTDQGVQVQSYHQVSQVGDEARMFFNRFPRGKIYIGKDRRVSIEAAIRDRTPFIILDDGFQSTHIEKDIKIMLLNPLHPYYYLRNFKRWMQEEDIILCYRPQGQESFQEKGGKGDRQGESQGETDWQERTEANSGHIAGHSGRCRSPIWGVYHFESGPFRDVKGKIVEVKELPLFGFSALGDNRRFKEDLSAFNLTGFKAFRDHHPFNAKDLENLDGQRKEQGASFLVCTEKDFIKLKPENLTHIPLIYCQNSIKFNLPLMDMILKYAEEKSFLQTSR